MWTNDTRGDAPGSWDSFSGLDLQQLLLSDPHVELGSQQAAHQQPRMVGLGSADDVALGSWGPRSGLELDLQAAAAQLQFYDSVPQPLNTQSMSGPSIQTLNGSQMQMSLSGASLLAQNLASLPQPAQHFERQSTLSLNTGDSSFFPAAGLNLGGVPSGWAGHRVVAVQGEIVSPTTVLVNLDSGEISQVPSQSPMQVQAQQMQPVFLQQVQQPITWVNGGAQQAAQQLQMANARMDARAGIRGRPVSSISMGGRYPQQYPQQQYPQQQFRNGRAASVMHQQSKHAATASVRAAAAPTWAGADWNPMRGVQGGPAPRSMPSLSGSGTGVFLPRSDQLAAPASTSAVSSTAAAAQLSMPPAVPSPNSAQQRAAPKGSSSASAGVAAAAGSAVAGDAGGRPAKAVAESVEMDLASSESMTDTFPVAMLMMQ